MKDSYKHSHLAKGSNYDHFLNDSPFDHYMANIESDILTRLLQRYYPKGISRYLDFACGTGRITEIVAPMASRSYGVDISEKMVAQARTKCPQTQFYVGDFITSGMNLEPVDLVTSFRFFGNAEHSLRTAAFAFLNSRLRVGGVLIINNHRNPMAIQSLLYSVTGGEPDMDLDHNTLRKYLNASGFKIRTVHGIGFWVVRHSLCRRETLESRAARLLEPLSSLPFAARFSPDAIVIDEKIRTV